MTDVNGARRSFLRRLQTDKNYQSFVADPLRAQRKEFEAILKDVDSTEGQIRYAQGALKVLDWHEWIFEHNDRQIDAIERNEKEKKDAGPRKPNYTPGRYCT